PGQILVALQQRLSFVLLQEPGTVFPLPRERRAYPVGQRRRYDSNRLRCLGFLPNHQQHLGAAAFSRGYEPLHLVNRYRIQVEVIDHRGHVSRLLPDDLRAGVFQDAGTVNPRLKLRAHEVFDGLADTPHAGIPFARSSVKLHHLRRQRGESSRNQHSSRTVMLGRPVFPVARADMAVAISMLIAVSSRGSELSPSTLKNNQSLSRRIVVGWSNSLAYMPPSVHDRSLIAARCASSIVRCIFSASRQLASSSRRSLKVGMGLE